MRFFGAAFAATLTAGASAVSFSDLNNMVHQVEVPKTLVADSAKSVNEAESIASVLLFAGTYSRDEGWVNGTGKGVHVFQLNPTDGSLKAVGAKAVGFNPTSVAGTNDAKRRVIYTANGVSDPSVLKPNTKTGWVYALSVDAAGTLTELNKVESGGASAVYVSVSPDEKFVTVANYEGGSVSIFPIKADGSLGVASDFRQYPKGRDNSHMHSMTWVGKGSTGLFGADLGNDRVVQFNVEATTGKLVDNAQPFVDRPVGSGARHMTIHPTQKYAYVVDELTNTIGVYALTASTGSLSSTALQSISTLPATFTGKSTSADIHVSEDGKYLYSSNRGHDSIAMFKIGADGQLTLIGHEPSRGKTPRGFVIYKDLLVVSNQDSNDIYVFRIDAATGKLTYTNQSATCGTPVGLFIPRY